MTVPILGISGGGNDTEYPAEVMDVVRSLGYELFAMPETNRPWDDALRISDFIIANGIQGCHLVGCSLGGLTVVHYVKHLNSSLISKVSTVDSPLAGLHNDWWYRLANLAGLPIGQFWSASTFMTALRNDSLPSPLDTTATQWMNTVVTPWGGFKGQVLPVVPQPLFSIAHHDLFLDPATWERVLDGD